ncbi:orotate phosphoribosyltransferase [Aedoeadaptatus urinae]|uniref:orotate phosphoribosyltransferase n=1 Tax=Aedoeadaptatus urinae TaxID=1871017 RepID=UPI00097CE4E0|nr:orotate phosphoribosyltransferase [Peptoniphilus urinae]
MKAVCDYLLDIGAVSLSPNAPFTWASGIKSPIYCDNRLILSYPEARKVIEEALADLVKREFPEAQAVLGTATAGIPHASYISWILDMPSGFIRSKAKDHGKNKRIEGAFKEGEKVVVVEDLFSTGGSSIDAAKACEAEGLEVVGIISIFSYELKAAEENFAASGFKHASLATFPELAEVAVARGDLSEEEKNRLNQWRKDPYDESWYK